MKVIHKLPQLLYYLLSVKKGLVDLFDTFIIFYEIWNNIWQKKTLNVEKCIYIVEVACRQSCSIRLTNSENRCFYQKNIKNYFNCPSQESNLGPLIVYADAG